MLQWFTPPVSRPPYPPTPFPAPSRAAEAGCPRGDGALPAVSVIEVIAPHAAWLRRLRYAYGAEPADFDRDIAAVVARYAQYVHLLPATADRHFRSAGGLFRMGLETGFHALQATDAALFSGRETLSRRWSLAPRWRHAAFLAGLLSAPERCLHRIAVSNDRGEQWPAHLRPLWPWLRDTKCARYHLRWLPRTEPNGTLGTSVLSHIVSPAMLQYLGEGNSLVVPQLMAAISANTLHRESDTLGQLVRRASALVIERDLRANALAPAANVTSIPSPSPAAGTIAPEPLPPLTLSAPARLHPAVRAALGQIVATLDTPDLRPAALVVAAGVFVPLPQFERRGVDPALAVRALSDAGMLVCDPAKPQSKTSEHPFAGKDVLGVVVAPHFLHGLDARAFGGEDRAPETTP